MREEQQKRVLGKERFDYLSEEFEKQKRKVRSTAFRRKVSDSSPAA